MTTTITPTQEIIVQSTQTNRGDSLFRPIWVFFRALRRNPVGLVGFIGLLVYAVMVFIAPLFVPFDDVVRLDQIAAPPGSRVMLLTRAADANTYTSLDSLAGRTVGYVRETGGVEMIEAYLEANPNAFETEDTRWRSGRGVPDAMQTLVDGDVDALLVFSESVKRYITNDPNTPFSSLAVSNSTLGRAYLFGTDTQGRDIFSHVVNGGASLIFTAILAGFFSTLLAVTFGSLAALVGGVVDTILTAIANFVLTIPSFPLLVVLASLIRLDNNFLLALLIGGLSWPVLMRAVRSQVLSLRERDYVEAAIALNLGVPHIILREILPNMASFVAINFIFAVTSAMYQQVGLIFLGMAPINDYTWGVMLYFGRSRGTLFSPDSALMVLAPVLAIAMFQVSMVLFARAVEEMFDPRLRTVK